MIRNISNRKIVSENAREATGIIDKTFGMILAKNSAGLIFRTRFGIHTFFMSRPIDVIVLDSNNNVVQIQNNLAPSKFFFWNPKYDILIEVPQNSVKDSQTKIGDRLKFG